MSRFCLYCFFAHFLIKLTHETDFCYPQPGEIEGSLPLKPGGQPRVGMPHDAIFIPKGHNRTFAQMSD